MKVSWDCHSAQSHLIVTKHHSLIHFLLLSKPYLNGLPVLSPSVRTDMCWFVSYKRAHLVTSYTSSHNSWNLFTSFTSFHFFSKVQRWSEWNLCASSNFTSLEVGAPCCISSFCFRVHLMRPVLSPQIKVLFWLRNGSVKSLLWSERARGQDG